MLGEAEVDLLLATPVKAVRSAGKLTTVTAADGERYVGKTVICTVPMNPLTAAWAERELADGTLLVAFAPPGKVDMNDHASVQRALRTLLPGAQVVAVTGYHWTEDSYALGTWCMYRPNQFTRYLQALGAREGNIFFASADSANGWRGFIDGAIEGGSRAAREATNYLNGA